MVGVVSLFVSDIVGSTGRWLADEESMRLDLELHDDVVARVVAQAGGRVFKHTGDGAMATFSEPVAAVDAAVRLQAAVAEIAWHGTEPLRVRAGVHSGSVHERGGDLFGSAVNRAARLVGVCPAGAVVVSGVTADLMRERVGVSLVPVGEVALRGFDHLERVFAVLDDRVSPIDSLDVVVGRPSVGNLPHVDGELFGRADELERIWDALAQPRLVTLTGSGGMGKTRLALEAAVAVERRYGGGGWLCDLSAITSADAVASVLLESVGGRLTAGRTAVASLIDRFGSIDVLVVVDNCEHVLSSARDVIAAIRAACPQVSIIATSREALGLAGETLIPVDALAPEAAYRLFLERARAVRPDLEVRDSDAVAIRTICERVDGIPLAVELAAARCRSMSAPEIADRLADRFRLLRSGSAGDVRHRTLEAAVDWSYSMLGDDERHVFNTLSVFAGGTLLDALVTVTGLDEYDVVDAVDRLVARSLVIPSPTRLGTRYRQLETLRQYGEDRLVEQGLIREVRDRHLVWMNELCHGSNATWGTPLAPTAWYRFASEVDNLRVAVSHAVASGRVELAYRAVADSALAACARPSFELLDWIDPTSDPGPWTEARSDAAALIGLLGFFSGDVDALPNVVSMMPEHHRARWPVCRWRVMERIFVADASGIEALLAESSPPQSEHGRLHREIQAISAPAVRVPDARDRDLVATIQVRADAAELVDRVRSTGDPLTLILALTTQALLLCNSGSPEEALPIAFEADGLAREYGVGLMADTVGVVISLAMGGLAGADVDDRRAAREFYERLAEAKQRRNHMVGVAMFGGIALLVAPHDAATAYTLDVVRTRSRPGYRGLLPEASAGLDAHTVGLIRSRAAQLDLVDAIDLALAALGRIIDDAPSSAE